MAVSMPARPAAPASELRLLLILSALMAFTSLSTDIYLPAMPQMARELQGNMELTITSFLVGFALAQLVWGPVSDRIGRRRPLVIGVLLMTGGATSSRRDNAASFFSCILPSKISSKWLGLYCSRSSPSASLFISMPTWFVMIWSFPSVKLSCKVQHSELALLR